MRKKLLHLAVVFTTAMGAFAQTYQLSHFDAAYSELSAGTTLNTNAWFYNEYTIESPFAISLFGDTIGNLTLSNGILYADSQKLDNIQYQLFAQTAELLDAGYVFMEKDNASQSPLRYEISGESGSRILKIEVSNAANGNENFEKDSKNMRVSFQYWFYENEERIELRYGKNSVDDFETFFNDDSVPGQKTPKFSVILAQLLMEQPDQSRPQQIVSLSGTADQPVYSQSMTLSTLSSYPREGRVYQFSKGNLSVDKHSFNKAQVFPNPTEKHLNVTWESSGKATAYTILNLMGQSVQRGYCESNQAIDVGLLPSGIYFLKLDGIKTVKFVKK